MLQAGLVLGTLKSRVGWGERMRYTRWRRRWFVYRIKVKGIIDAGQSEGLESFVITPQDNGETMMIGALSDQARLPGVIGRIEDLGLELLSVEHWRNEKGVVLHH